MPARADYVCTRCEEKGACSESEPWRDLPVKDARCPSCGAKKFMQRMWSGYSPMISTNGDMQRFKIADDRVEPLMLAAQGRRDSALRSEKHAIQAESVVPGINMRVRAVPAQQLGAALGGFGARVGAIDTGKASPAAITDPMLAGSAAGFGQHLKTGAPGRKVESVTG